MIGTKPRFHPIFQYMVKKDWETVLQMVLEENELIYTQDPFGWTLLDYAFFQGNEDVINRIYKDLKPKINLNYVVIKHIAINNTKPFISALEKGYITNPDLLFKLKTLFYAQKNLHCYKKVSSILLAQQNIQPLELDSRTKDIFTAAEFGDWPAVFAYLDQGEPDNLQDGYGLSLRDYAYFEDNNEVFAPYCGQNFTPEKTPCPLFAPKPQKPLSELTWMFDKLVLNTSKVEKSLSKPEEKCKSREAHRPN